MPETRYSVYALMLGGVIFLFVFAAFLYAVPAQIYNSPYQNANVTTPNGPNYLMYSNQSNTFSMAKGDDIRQTLTGGIVLRFQYVLVPFGLEVSHIDYQIFSTVIWSHDLGIAGGQSVGWGGSFILNPTNLSPYYDMASDSYIVTMQCDHVTVHLRIYSNVTTTKVQDAFRTQSPIKIAYDYEVNWSAMGTNVLSIILNVLVGQTIQTGEHFLDLFLNALITVPVDLSLIYVLYRLITGIIPTLSGGGGS